ncbi:hypothetical protein Salat_0062400 [Sesamum alatum]|uniref:Uncharacterized protein n=1 Tax=Sesamum alatum TaxID=300844 RepID=A0AAE2CWP8_9LAMI|nr:hypothetical protein Salat_0062400 [Sesamum alatum]
MSPISIFAAIGSSSRHKNRLDRDDDNDGYDYAPSAYIFSLTFSRSKIPKMSLVAMTEIGCSWYKKRPDRDDSSNDVDDYIRIVCREGDGDDDDDADYDYAPAA